MWDFAPTIRQMFNVAQRLAEQAGSVVSPTPVQVEIRKRVWTLFSPKFNFIGLT